MNKISKRKKGGHWAHASLKKGVIPEAHDAYTNNGSAPGENLTEIENTIVTGDKTDHLLALFYEERLVYDSFQSILWTMRIV